MSFVRHRAPKAIWALGPRWVIYPTILDAYVRETGFKIHLGRGSKSCSVMSGPKPIGPVFEISTYHSVAGKLPGASISYAHECLRRPYPICSATPWRISPPNIIPSWEWETIPMSLTSYFQLNIHLAITILDLHFH